MLLVEGRNIDHVREQGSRMMLEASGFLAQIITVRDHAAESGTVDKIAGMDFFAVGKFHANALLVNLQRSDLGPLPGYRSVMNREMVKVGVDILAKPMVFVLGTGSELEAFAAVVDCAGPMVGESEGTLHAAGCTYMIGEAVRINGVLELRHAVLC